MAKEVDPFRFIGGISKRMIKSWIKMEEPRPIPWTPLAKPLAESSVALLSTGGIALKTDEPFDQEGERQNPWWGDPSYRILPHTATAADIRVYHLHVNPIFAEEDINCLLPLERLREMEAAGRIGRVTPRHYSTMGYVMDPEILLTETVPAIINDLREDLADVVVLIPA